MSYREQEGCRDPFDSQKEKYTFRSHPAPSLMCDLKNWIEEVKGHEGPLLRTRSFKRCGRDPAITVEWYHINKSKCRTQAQMMLTVSCVLLTLADYSIGESLKFGPGSEDGNTRMFDPNPSIKIIKSQKQGGGEGKEGKSRVKWGRPALP